MKTWKMWVVILLACQTLAQGSSSADILNLQQVDKRTLKKVMAGKLPGKILKIEEGEKIPLHLFLKGDFVYLIEEDSCRLYIKTKQDIYVKQVNGNYLFSIDASNWKTLGELLMGKLSVNLDIDPSGEPFVKMGAEIYEKK